MKYTNIVRALNEKIIYKSKLHWIIYFPGICNIVISFIFLEFKGMELWSLLFMLIGLSSLIKALVRMICTEIISTLNSIIYKTGLIKRETLEMNHREVESISVNQSILGRILGFGTIKIKGTGGTDQIIEDIDDPIEFRKHYVDMNQL